MFPIGKLISFEGLDGSGKSSIIKGVKKQLEKQGKTVLVLQEPGGTQLAKKIRTLVKSDTPRCNLAESLLFLAARADLLESSLRPNIKHYDFVLVDRFIDSTVAYQGYGNKQDLEMIKTLNRTVVGVTVPDLTILVQVPLEVAIERIMERGKADRFEGDIDYLKRVEKGYKAIQKLEPDRIKVVKNDELELAIESALQLILTMNNRKTEHKRESLAKLTKAESGTFKATVGRIGRNDKDKPTLLLQEVRKKGGRKTLADHTWVLYTRELIKAGTLLPGDVIEFDASVEPYTHISRTGQEYQEYGLENLTNVVVTKAVRVKKNKDEFQRDTLDRLLAITDKKLFEESVSRYLRYVSAMCRKYFV